MTCLRSFLAFITVALFSQGFAEGFAVQAAFRYDFDGDLIGQAEGGYSAKVLPSLEVGGRLALDLNPIGESTTVFAYGFGEYRNALLEEAGTTTSAYVRAELGAGYINSEVLKTFFPRGVVAVGVDGRSPTAGTIDGFGQFKLSFDYVPTNRAKFGVSNRVGLIVIPVVPYVAFEVTYDLTPQEVDVKAYVGSLLYLSPQFFLGVDVGMNNAVGYARLFASFSER